MAGGAGEALCLFLKRKVDIVAFGPWCGPECQGAEFLATAWTSIQRIEGRSSL